MKMLRLSDEDYLALLQALDTAGLNAQILSTEDRLGLTVQEVAMWESAEAKRLYDLIKPIEYPTLPEFTEVSEMAARLSEKISMIAQATWLLNQAGIDVPIVRDGEVIYTFKARP